MIFFILNDLICEWAYLDSNNIASLSPHNFKNQAEATSSKYKVVTLHLVELIKVDTIEAIIEDQVV